MINKLKRIFYILISVFFLTNLCQESEGSDKEKNINKKKESENRKRNFNDVTKNENYDENLNQKQIELKEYQNQLFGEKNKINAKKKKINLSEENIIDIKDLKENKKDNFEINSFQNIKLNDFFEIKKNEGSIPKVSNFLKSDSIYLKFNNVYGYTKFGIVAAESENNDDYIREQNEKFNEIFEKTPEDITFKGIISKAGELLKKNENFNTEFFIKIARVFRHLKNKNPYGDFLCEYILINLINHMENKEKKEKNEDKELSEIFYDLSQVYLHLTHYSKIKWTDFTKEEGILFFGDKKNKEYGFDEIKFSDAELKKKRLNLLYLSLSFDPEFSPAWVRVIEFYFYEDKSHEETLLNLKEDEKKYFCSKWKEAYKWNSNGKKPKVYFSDNSIGEINSYCESFLKDN